MSETTPTEGLYGDTPGAPAPAPAAPGPLDLVVGIFTEPVALFKRLAVTPVWGWALGIMLLASIAMTLAWAAKVDVDAFFRPMLEAKDVPADKIDAIIEMQGKFLGVFGVIQVAIMVPLVTVIMATFYWLIGKSTGETQAPSFRQAFSGTVTGGLVGLPKLLLMVMVCLLKPFGGVTPDKLSPTSLGFFVTTESVKLGAFLRSLDLFTFAGIFMVYLAARHTLRLKTSGAAACAVVGLLMTIGMQVLFAR